MLIIALSYQLPIWVIFLILFSSSLLLILNCHYFFNRYLYTQVTKDERQTRVISTLATVTIGLYGILFGLIFVTLWQNYYKTQEIVSKEATALSVIVLDSEALPAEIRVQIKQTIKEYVADVLHFEWGRMDLVESPTTWLAWLNVVHTIQSYKPRNSYENIYYSTILSSMNEAAAGRRARLDSLLGTIPGPIFSILFLGAALVIVSLSLMVVIAGSYLLFMNIAISLFLALSLTIAVDLHSFFTGTLTISDAPFTQGVFKNLK